MARKSIETSKSVVTRVTRRSTRNTTVNEDDDDFSPPTSSLSKSLSPSDQGADNGTHMSLATPDIWAEDLKGTSRRTSQRAATKVRKNMAEILAPGQTPLDFALQQVTPEEVHEWKGWCEVESDPAFLNVILHEAGVKGIKVQEVFSLEEEMLTYLPKTIYGLIFLFQFDEDDDDEQEVICPDNVWFANQVASNACATVALLNMVMNLDEVELGDELRNFKDFTENMTPPDRGQVIANFDFVRSIHNSFARKMDMLNADLSLSNDASAAKCKGRGKKGKAKAKEEDEDSAGFHFIAFIPIDGYLWKLDGLQRQPTNLGEVDQDWMDLARPMITERMEKCEDGNISFSLQAICRSPLLSLPEDLATNIASIKATEARLDELITEWKAFSPDEQATSFENTIRAADTQYNVTPEILDGAQPQGSIRMQLEDLAMTTEALMAIRKDLITSQTALRSAFMEEVASVEEDAERARGRRFDYTPFIATWIRLLAEKSALRELWQAVN